MRDALLTALRDAVDLPMPLVFGLLAAAAFWRRPRLSRALFGLFTLLLVLVCLPVLGERLTEASVRSVPALRGGEPPSVVLVPTGGVFGDRDSGFWPTPSSLERLVRGRRIAAELSVPLIVSGGDPVGRGISEARALAHQLDLESGPGLWIDPVPADSIETGRSVARLLRARGLEDAIVVLVTSCPHYLRMAAALRRWGVGVRRPAGDGCSPPKLRVQAFVPSSAGLAGSRTAFHEIVGIGWGLATGALRWRDL